MVLWRTEYRFGLMMIQLKCASEHHHGFMHRSLLSALLLGIRTLEIEIQPVQDHLTGLGVIIIVPVIMGFVL